MLCPTCDTPFVPDRLFCMNCGEISPEGARVMGLNLPGYGEAVPPPPPRLALPAPKAVEVLPARPTPRPAAIAVPRPTSVTAIMSLLFGCLAWFGMPILGALAAVVSGHFARREIRLSRGQLTGGGLATAGLVLGYAQVALLTLIGMAVTLAILGAIAAAN